MPYQIIGNHETGYYVKNLKDGKLMSKKPFKTYDLALRQERAILISEKNRPTKKLLFY